MKLPSGWTTEPFEQVARFETGRTPARANPAYWAPTEEKVAWVAISDMEQYGVITKTAEFISGKAFREVFRGRSVSPGTLLMSFKLTIGRTATLAVPACHNEAIISIYPRSGIDQRFLGYFLSQVDYSDHQDRQVKGNTLNQSKINGIPILLPPESEQRGIADLLDRIRAGIHVEVSAEQALSSMKAVAMRRVFSHGLRDEMQKESEIGQVPQSWSVEPIGAHHSVTSGGTPSRANQAFWDGGTIPWVKTTEVDYRLIVKTEEHITQAGLDGSAAKLLPAGTLLLAMYGQGVTRGKVAILGIEAACNQACAAIRPADDKIEPKYLYHFLAYRYGAMRQLAHGGQQQNLNLEIVRDSPVAFPTDKGEQREVIEILDAIDQKIDWHKQKRHVLEELFTALLQKLMRGEILVGDLDLSVFAQTGEGVAA